MCIIAVKNIGVKMPDADTIENMWWSNPDGAGYMIATGKRVVIRKGFMDLDSFRESINSHGDLTNKAVVLHFRIATHGGTNRECCHPFPLTDDLESLHRRKAKATFGVAHNGVVSGMATDNKLKISDTIAYIMDVLAPLGEMCDLTADWRARSIIEATAGSKFAIMRKDGNIATFGDFIKADDGMLYSNDTYLGWESFNNFYGFGTRYGSTYGSTYGKLIPADNFPLPFPDCVGCVDSADCAKYGAYCADETDAQIARSWNAA